MEAREPGFTEITARLKLADAAMDNLIASDDPEISYAATTAALHLHAAQAELTHLGTIGIAAPVAADEHSTDPVGLLIEVINTVNDALPSLPASQRAAGARIALHLAEARDALRGGSV